MEETDVFVHGQTFTIESSTHSLSAPSSSALSSARAPTRSTSAAKRGGGSYQRKAKRTKHRAANPRFVGLSWDASSRAWQAYIDDQSGRREDLGTFGRESDAARAYDAAVVERHLDLKLNFPLEVRSKGKRRAGRRPHATASRFTGVRWDNVTNAWCAHAVMRLAVTLIGHFEREDDAARAYNAFVVANGLTHPRNAVEPAKSGARGGQPEMVTIGEVLSSDTPLAPIVPIVTPMPSPFTSVAWDSPRGEWRTVLSAPDEPPQVEYFADDLSAARAFDAFALANNLARDTSFALLSAEERELLASMTPASVAKG